MWKVRLGAVVIIIAGAALGYFIYGGSPDTFRNGFKFGLDLTGGTHMVYEADTAAMNPMDVDAAMSALRDVIESRVNVFGVAEPLVQVERAGAFSEGAGDYRLIVELPGFTDVEQAAAYIGKTPLLEFKLLDMAATTTGTSAVSYTDTGLTGRYVTRAQVEFMGGSRGGVPTEPVVRLTLNAEGKQLFSDITTNNVNRQLAIFLDGALVSEPVIREPITDGVAIISGGFTAEEAKGLASDLNIGALPVPITLLSSEVVGASLGADTLSRGIMAGIWGYGFVALFMILWYRLPGVVAVVALTGYMIMTLAIFKAMGVTITAAGIAGLILSIGMAVDANVLIFERIKEELKTGKALRTAIEEGFSRAWLAIRDGHFTALFSAIILFWIGTSVVEGFALIYAIGVLLSLFSGITVTRTILIALGLSDKPLIRTLFSSGFSK